MQRLLHPNYLYLVPLLLSAIFSLRSFRQKWPKPYRLFSLLIVISAVIEFLAIAWKWYAKDINFWPYGPNNHWIYNPFITIEFALLMLVFAEVFQKTRLKKVSLLSMWVFIALGMVSYFFIEGPLDHNTSSAIAANILLIAFIFVYFNQLLKDKNVIVLHKEPMVWLMLGTFIYHSASIPYLSMLAFLNANAMQQALHYLFVNHILNSLMYLFYLIAFLCKPYPKPLP